MSKITKPYELLVRFGIDGQVSGAHIKAQSYYTDEAGAPDLQTWREDEPTPTALESPEVAELVAACALSLADQLAAAQAEIVELRAQLPSEG